MKRCTHYYLLAIYESKAQWDTTSHLLQWLLSRRLRKNTCGWVFGEKRTLVHCWWGCNDAVNMDDSMKFLQKIKDRTTISSVQFGRSVVSDSLWPHELEHARPLCLSPTPGVHPDSRPSSQWCHPAISSSVVPFSSCPQSLPASESFPMSQIFAWGGQSTGISALASFLPKKSQGWSPLKWTG